VAEPGGLDIKVLTKQICCAIDMLCNKIAVKIDGLAKSRKADHLPLSFQWVMGLVSGG
jgi:hypothetical protein